MENEREKTDLLLPNDQLFYVFRFRCVVALINNIVFGLYIYIYDCTIYLCNIFLFMIEKPWEETLFPC